MHESGQRRSTISSCAIAKYFCFKVDYSKASLYLVVEVLTGHWPNNVDASRLRILLGTSCKSYSEEDEVKTSQYLVLHGLNFPRSWLIHFRVHTLRHAAELVENKN